MVSTCTTVVLTAIQVVIAGAGAALVVLGSLHLEDCPVEESLPVWMIAAGATLLLLTLLIVTYALCTCCGPSCSCRRIRGSGSEKESAYYSSPASLASSSNNNYKSYKSSEGVGKTLCALGCAFVCGGLGVIFLLVWLALWVAGTYFVAAAVGRMRDEKLAPNDQVRETCDVPSVAVSICSVALVWALFLGGAIWAACALGRVASKGGRERRQQQQQQQQQHWYQQQQQQQHFQGQQQHLYDQVASDDQRC